MSDREKVIMGLKCCSNTEGSCMKCPYSHDVKTSALCMGVMAADALELLKEQQETITSLQGTICKLNAALQEQSQWHPFNPVEPDTDGLEDHNFYLVTVKGFGTPMKAMYHIDMPFGFLPPPTKDFDPYDVIAWRELPDNMNEEVKQDG